MAIAKEKILTWVNDKIEKAETDLAHWSAVKSGLSPIPISDEATDASTKKLKYKKNGRTASDVLINPEKGVRKCIIDVLKKNKQKKLSSQDIIKKITTCKPSDEDYRKITRSIQQTLRIGAKSSLWQASKEKGDYFYYL